MPFKKKKKIYLFINKRGKRMISCICTCAIVAFSEWKSKRSNLGIRSWMLHKNTDFKQFCNRFWRSICVNPHIINEKKKTNIFKTKLICAFMLYFCKKINVSYDWTLRSLLCRFPYEHFCLRLIESSRC